MFDMLGNIINNLFSRPSTRNYPMIRREPFSKARGRIDMDINGCIFCGICSRKCPSGAISVNRGEKSWEIDPFKCVICSECEQVCPKKCIRTEAQYKTSAYEKSNLKYVQPQKQQQQEPDGKPGMDGKQDMHGKQDAQARQDTQAKQDTRIKQDLQ